MENRGLRDKRLGLPESLLCGLGKVRWLRLMFGASIRQ